MLKQIFFTIIILFTTTIVSADTSHAAARFTGADLTVAVFLPHNEGTDPLRWTADVPRYDIESNLTFRWWKLRITSTPHMTVGQDWSTVHVLGAGGAAMTNAKTWGADLTPYFYQDLQVDFRASKMWSLGFRARVSHTKTVSNSFAIVATKDFFKTPYDHNKRHNPKTCRDSYAAP